MALTVNGEDVKDEVLATEAESVRRRLEQLSDEQRKEWGLDPAALQARAIEWARENVIEQTLLRQAAVADPATVDGAEVEQRFASLLKNYGGPEKLAEAGIDEGQLRGDIERQLKVERLIASVTDKAREPKPKELAQSYRTNKDRYRVEEMVRAAHIVKHVEKGVSEEEAKAAADAIYARLQTGESFEQIADRHSDCPGGGGDLGYFPRGKMVREFEDVVFNMPVGATSGVFKTVFGFHIVKLTDRKLPGLRPFGEVRDEIRKELVEARRTQLLEQYVDSLREKATVEGL